MSAAPAASPLPQPMADWLRHLQAHRRYSARLHAQGLGPRSLARALAAWRGFYQWW
ncbi:site-specific integrase, partial [Bordetella pertussis]|uniref:site-specific integrase n=1 Tax=Bordetella pertussis TaxID=520 RepID=UPI000AD217BD